MMDWKTLKDKIDAAVEETLLTPDQDVVDVFKYSISKEGPGIPNDNQIFTTWFFGGADVNYMADWCYFLQDLAVNQDIPMSKLAQMFRFWVIQPSEFGNYCGLSRQWGFTQEINKMLDSLDKETFLSLMDSYRCYLANINVWVFHYLPWGVGYAFPRKDKAFYQEGLELLAQP